MSAAPGGQGADASPALFTIRPARPEESAAVAELTERGFAVGPYGHLPVSPERRALVEAVDVRAATGTVLVAVAGPNGSGGPQGDAPLLGTASVLRADSPHARLASDDEAELRLLAVAPTARGRGLGEALALAAQEEAIAWGASAIVLDTGTLNLTAQRLYERLGYEVFGPVAGGPDVGDPAVGGPVDAADAAASAPRIDHLDYRLPLQPRDDIVVRLVRDEEIDEVAALSLRAYEHAYELSEEYRESILDVGGRAREHQVWVAADRASGAVLGTVATPRRGSTISPLAQPGELDFRLLAVDPPARGRGIGEALTRLVVELARLRGLRRVVMNSGEQMTGAHRLYERLGFTRLPEREHELVVDDGRRIRLLAFTIDVPRESRRPAA